MNTYTKISFADGAHCICEARDVADMTEGCDGYALTEVQMTVEQFNALPEFQG